MNGFDRIRLELQKTCGDEPVRTDELGLSRLQAHLNSKRQLCNRSYFTACVGGVYSFSMI